MTVGVTGSHADSGWGIETFDRGELECKILL